MIKPFESPFGVATYVGSPWIVFSIPVGVSSAKVPLKHAEQGTTDIFERSELQKYEIPERQSVLFKEKSGEVGNAAILILLRAHGTALENMWYRS